MIGDQSKVYEPHLRVAATQATRVPCEHDNDNECVDEGCGGTVWVDPSDCPVGCLDPECRHPELDGDRTARHRSVALIVWIVATVLVVALTPLAPAVTVLVGALMATGAIFTDLALQDRADR